MKTRKGKKVPNPLLDGIIASDLTVEQLRALLKVILETFDDCEIEVPDDWGEDPEGEEAEP